MQSAVLSHELVKQQVDLGNVQHSVRALRPAERLDSDTAVQ